MQTLPSKLYTQGHKGWSIWCWGLLHIVYFTSDSATLDAMKRLSNKGSPCPLGPQVVSPTFPSTTMPPTMAVHTVVICYSFVVLFTCFTHSSSLQSLFTIPVMSKTALPTELNLIKIKFQIWSLSSKRKIMHVAMWSSASPPPYMMVRFHICPTSITVLLCRHRSL